MSSDDDEVFMLVSLELEGFNLKKEKTGSVDLRPDLVLHNITHGLTKVFGASSAAPVELNQLEKGKDRLDLVLSCPSHFAKRLRASLTLQGVYQGHPCVYTVKQVDKKPLQISRADSQQLRYYSSQL